jgi:phosphate acyltransferase
MRVACDLVVDGKASAVLSVGNSGAMMATALAAFGRLDGVHRPAIGTRVPYIHDGKRRCTVLVDAGANVDCEALHMAQWGVLGAAFVAGVDGVARPRIGVLSNGSEEGKGTALTRQVLSLLRTTSMDVVGYVEGDDMLVSVADVFVTDGFTGNVLLKTMEGTFRFLSRALKDVFLDGWTSKMAGLVSKPVFNRFRDSLDPRTVGAAPLLGLARPAFIAHGKSDAVAVRYGILGMRTFVDSGVMKHMQQGVDAAAGLRKNS